MAWRPTQYLVEGELDNTVLGKVTGWMKFAGIGKKIIFNLKGDFHRDIRGTKIKYSNPEPETKEAKSYMKGFNILQEGEVGDITAGNEPVDYVSYPYIEWYGEANGRVVLELEKENIKIIGTPIPAFESYPVNREKQSQNMTKFLDDMAKSINLESDKVIITNGLFAMTLKDKNDEKNQVNNN